MEDIEKHAPVVKASNEKITETQQELVHVILHDGCSPTEAAKRLGRNKAWAYNTLKKQHVIEYRQQLAMMTLGWDATQAMATMRELLNSKSQYVAQSRQRFDGQGRTAVRTQGMLRPQRCRLISMLTDGTHTKTLAYTKDRLKTDDTKNR